MAKARAKAKFLAKKTHKPIAVIRAQLRPKIVTFVAAIKAKMMSFFSMFR